MFRAGEQGERGRDLRWLALAGAAWIAAAILALSLRDSQVESIFDLLFGFRYRLSVATQLRSLQVLAQIELPAKLVKPSACHWQPDPLPWCLANGYR